MPQLGQNLAVGERLRPQLAQVRASLAPQWTQKWAPALTGWWQEGQRASRASGAKGEISSSGAGGVGVGAGRGTGAGCAAGFAG